MSTINILGISGSNRRKSYSTSLLRAVGELAPDGVEIQIANIADLPMYDDDLRHAAFPAPAERLRKQIQAADALLISTREYNRSLPPLLKNAIDWGSRPPLRSFDGKPVAIISSSPGALGGAFANHHLRQVLVFLNAWVVPGPEVIVTGVGSKLDAGGALTDDGVRDALAKLMMRLADDADGRKFA